jgi:hypothetical protein
MFVAEWVREQVGQDPAEPWRGRYSTERGALRRLRKAGGMIALVDTGLNAVGMTRTATPGRGDVAVVCGAEGETGAIITGEFSASLGQRGLFFRKAPIVGAWSF